MFVKKAIRALATSASTVGVQASESLAEYEKVEGKARQGQVFEVEDDAEAATVTSGKTIEEPVKRKQEVLRVPLEGERQFPAVSRMTIDSLTFRLVQVKPTSPVRMYLESPGDVVRFVSRHPEEFSVVGYSVAREPEVEFGVDDAKVWTQRVLNAFASYKPKDLNMLPHPKLFASLGTLHRQLREDIPRARILQQLKDGVEGRKKLDESQRKSIAEYCSAPLEGQFLESVLSEYQENFKRLRECEMELKREPIMDEDYTDEIALLVGERNAARENFVANAARLERMLERCVNPIYSSAERNELDDTMQLMLVLDDHYETTKDTITDQTGQLEIVNALLRKVVLSEQFPAETPLQSLAYCIEEYRLGESALIEQVLAMTKSIGDSTKNFSDEARNALRTEAEDLIALEFDADLDGIMQTIAQTLDASVVAWERQVLERQREGDKISQQVMLLKQRWNAAKKTQAQAEGLLYDDAVLDPVQKSRARAKIEELEKEYDEMLGALELLDQQMREISLSPLQPNAASREKVWCDLPDLHGRVLREWEGSDASIANGSQRFLSKLNKRFLVQSNLLLPFSMNRFITKTKQLPPRMQHLLSSTGSNLLGAVLRSSSTPSTLVDDESHNYKVLKSFQQTEIEKLRRALLLSRRLHHPSILPCEGAFLDEIGLVWTVFPFLPGGNLKQWLEEQPRTKLERKLVLARVADALSQLHDVSVLHRDIKPENILMDSAAGDAVPRLTDFDTGKDATEVSLTLDHFGTLVYAAPELMSATGRFSKSSDVYALSIVCLLVLSSSVSSCDATTLQSRSVIDSLLQDMGVTGDAADKVLSDVLRSGLDLEPENRPSARRLHETLGQQTCCMNPVCLLAEEQQVVITSLEDSVICPQRQHAICRKDFAALLNRETDGTVYCPKCIPRPGDSKTSPFSHRTICSSLSENEFNSFLEVQKRRAVAPIEQPTSMLRLDDLAVMRQVQTTRRYLTDQVLADLCPSCSRYVDLVGVSTDNEVRCENCQVQICPGCLTVNNNQHSAKCLLRTANLTSSREELIKRARMERRVSAIRRYLNSLPSPNVRNAVEEDPFFLSVMRELGH